MTRLEQLELLGTPVRRAGTGYAPPLKWAGGKRWLVKYLRPLWEPHEEKRLVEPFAGGLAVTLGLLPERALLNDINQHLINFYQHLKSGLILNIHGGTTDQTFKRHRSAFNTLIRQGRAVGMHDDGKRAAMLFYYLNRHCYNGLCRFNKAGEFNTPNGRYTNPLFEKDLTSYQPIVSGWDFVAGDFAALELGPNDFVYADPPYDNAFTGYSGNQFGFKQQKDLAVWLAKHKGPVVLSNHATSDMLDLYEKLGFDTSRQYEAPRMIQCLGDRSPALEVLATLNL